MGKYGAAAILAVNIVRENAVDPIDAWRKAVGSMFPHSKSAREKNCPKSTFLGLCQEGLVIDIPPGIYTRSVENKDYALKAIRHLRRNPELVEDEVELWNSVLGEEKVVENSQMDVVTALWRKRLIRNDT